MAFNIHGIACALHVHPHVDNQTRVTLLCLREMDLACSRRLTCCVCINLRRMIVFSAFEFSGEVNRCGCKASFAFEPILLWVVWIRSPLEEAMVVGDKTATSPYHYFSDQTERTQFHHRKSKMDQSNPNRPKDKKRTTFIAIGGVVASVTALAVVFVLPTILRGDDYSDDSASFAAFLPANESSSNDSIQAPSIRVGGIAPPSTAPSIENSNLLPTSEPTQQLGNYSPTNLPTDDEVHTAPEPRQLN